MKAIEGSLIWKQFSFSSGYFTVMFMIIKDQSKVNFLYMRSKSITESKISCRDVVINLNFSD